MLKNNKGVSLISLVITIVVIIILSAVAIGGSTKMIDDSVVAVTEADKLEDNETIKSLLTYGVIDENRRTGITLNNDGVVVIVSEKSGDSEELIDVAYGTGYHLVVGGNEATINKIKGKTGNTGNTELKAYRELTAPYVVNYETGEYKRIEEIKFR